MTRALWIIFLAIAIGSASCGEYMNDDESIVAEFAELDIKASVHHDSVEGHQLRWIEVNQYENDSLPIIVFVHGAPGWANNWFGFLKDSNLYSSARLIALDRLGYYPNDAEPVTSIPLHSQALDTILSKYQYPSAIIVGHSYGGPISALYACKNPEKLKGIVLLAPALDPENEKDVFAARFTWWESTRWAIPNFLNKAGAEKRVHAKELKRIEPNWKNLAVPLIQLHATDDNVVPFVNLDYTRKMFPDSLTTLVTIEGGDHLLPWSAEEESKELIMGLLAQPIAHGLINDQVPAQLPY